MTSLKITSAFLETAIGQVTFTVCLSLFGRFFPCSFYIFQMKLVCFRFVSGARSLYTIRFLVVFENLVEAHRKCLLLVGVGSPTTSGMSYLFNLNIDNTFLAYWFFNAVYTTSRRGMRRKFKKNISFHSFLGKGYFNV